MQIIKYAEVKAFSWYNDLKFSEEGIKNHVKLLKLILISRESGYLIMYKKRSSQKKRL